MEKYIIAIGISVVTGFVTYIVQYRSVFAPCMIEFDGDSKREIAIMNRYNNIFDNIFRYYVILASLFCILFICTGKIPFMVMTLVFQMIYLVAATIVMVCMYTRSRVYWSVSAKKHKGEKSYGIDYICNMDICNNIYRKVG